MAQQEAIVQSLCVVTLQEITYAALAEILVADILFVC